jgi:two-component system chemotaxis response regulator CheY
MGANLRILVVDDMPAVRSILRGMLEELGFERIVEAEDGEMAWQLVREAATSGGQEFGLVIADWNMPGMSGADLLRAIRSFAPTRALPFFMVTAEGNRAHLAEAFHAGVTDYVVKPFSGRQLGDKIEKALRG